MATENEDKTKFVEIAKLLGFRTEYFSGMFRVYDGTKYVGQMSAEAWLDHLRGCVLTAIR